MVLSEGKGKAWAAEGAVEALVREMICPNPHRKCSVLIYLKKTNGHPPLLEHEVPRHEVVLQPGHGHPGQELCGDGALSAGRIGKSSLARSSPLTIHVMNCSATGHSYAASAG